MTNLRQIAPLALCVWLATSWVSQASATCSAGTAFTQGSQTGFARAQTLAQTIATNQTTAQSLLQKCLQSLASQATSIFPSLSSITSQIVQQVCTAASQEVNAQLGQISLTSEIDTAVSAANSAVSTATGGVVSNALTVGGSSAALPSNNVSSNPPSSFWSTIWQ